MTQKAFELAIQFTIKHEGYRSYDPYGLKTIWGLAEKYNPDVVDKMDKMTKEASLPIAKQYYYDNYWLLAHCDEFLLRSSIVVFDCAVNPSIGRAIQFVQRAVNVPDDGVFGKVTKKGIENFADMYIVLKVIDERRKYYQQKVIETPAKAVYLKGWLNRCDDLEKYVREI